MTDLSTVDTDSLLTAAGLTPNAHPVEQPPPGPDLSQVPNDVLMKAAGQMSVPIPPPNDGKAGPMAPGASSALPGFTFGLTDLFNGGLQFTLHALEAVAPAGSPLEKKAKELREAVDQKIADDEASYQKYRATQPDVQEAAQLSALTGKNVQALDVGRLLGNVAGSAPLAVAAPESLPARIAAGAATGAVAGAAQPSLAQGSDFWLEKAKQAAAGAVGGAVGAPIGGGVSRVIKPNTSEAADTLLESGVRLTPGQLAGKAASRFEEGATSFPIVGDVIKAGQRGAIEDFNRATINQALAPIGEKLAPDTPIGRKAIDEMAQKIKDNRNDLAPQVSVQVDQPFAQGSAQVMAMAQNLAPDKLAQFKKVFTGEVLNKFGPDGTMDGKTFMDVQSTIGRMATDYMHSAIVDERNFGRALGELDDQLSQLVVRTNPDAAKALQANNDAYAMLKRIQAASISSVKNEGVFTPAQLLQAVRGQDSTLGHSAFARGNALMQMYAEAGENILGSKLPDSGTAFRNMVDHPVYSAVMSPAALAALVPYSPLGRKLAGVILASRPSIAAPVATAARGFIPPAAGAVAGSQVNQPTQ